MPHSTEIHTTEKAAKIAREEQTGPIKRPTTLVLACNHVEGVTEGTLAYDGNQIVENSSEVVSIQQSRISKTLFRSNSSSLHKRKSRFVPAATTSASDKFKLSSELDQIFVICSDRPNIDDIEVIDERRMKNMPKSDRARLYKSNTFICEEYYTNEQLACVIDVDTKEAIVEEK